MSQGAGKSERVAFSAELSEFLIEFSIALHRTTMYPPGHPSQERAAVGVVQRLAALLVDRSSVSIGIARRQLVIEGVATDARHPVLRSLAEKLHQQHIGAVVFQRGISAAELADAMRTVAFAAEKSDRPLALEFPEKLRQWHNVRFHPLTYDQLELVDGEEDEAEREEPNEQREQGTRSAQLWIGLARAALSSEDKADVASTEPAVVAQAINEHPQAQAYDQVIVGYLLQIAQELRRDGGIGSGAVRRRMSRLIGSLDQNTLERLVHMGGDLSQRSKFVLDATEGLAVDAVVEIVRAAAQSGGQSISNSMLRLLSKLSAFADDGPPQLQVQADTAVREQVRDLIANWSLSTPNPESYTLALHSMATDGSLSQSTEQAYPPEPMRIVQMALEVDAQGVPLWRALSELQQNGELPALVALLKAAPPQNRAAKSIWQKLATEENVRTLLAKEAVDFDVVDPMLDRLPEQNALNVLLDTLASSDSRATRMAVFARLVALGEFAADAVVARLQDDRWFVQRNMLSLLNHMQHLPQSFSAAAFARHADPRVRREALQLWLRVPGERDRALLVGLKETDQHVLRTAVNAALKNCPAAAVPLIASRLGDKQLATDLRLNLIKLLEQTRNPLALEALLKLVVTGKTFLGAPKLAGKSPIVLVALKALSQQWAQVRRVHAVVQRAARSKDHEVRAAVRVTADAV